MIINSLLLKWEVAPQELERIEEPYDIGIVLTGVTLNKKSPKDRVYFKNGADRILHALMLYRKNKIQKILITGGTIRLGGQVDKSEAQSLKEILLLSKVPEEDIIIEEKARNTRENALFAKEILMEKFPQQKYLLITSAFHMRRARACFQKVGLSIDTFSAGFYTKDAAEVHWSSILPSEEAFYHSYILIHEVFGYVIYKVLGYA